MLVDFHGLYERYSPDVYRFAFYLSGDASLAEDITQETFVRAWVTPGEICGGTVKAYLLMIARNLFRSEWNRAARQVSLDDSLPDPKPSAEAVTDGRAELGVVLDALQKLSESDRSALLMHAQDDLSYAHIAAALGLSEGAVKVKVHRARIKLKALCNSKGE